MPKQRPGEEKAPFAAGDTVRAKGLRSAPELNGQLAKVVRWDAAGKRVVVRFDSGGKKLALRVSNIAAGTGEPPAETAPPPTRAPRARRKAAPPSAGSSRAPSAASSDESRSDSPPPPPRKAGKRGGGRGERKAKRKGSDESTSSSGPMSRGVSASSSESRESSVHSDELLGTLLSWTECPGNLSVDLRRYATISSDDGGSYLAYYPRDFRRSVRSRLGQRLTFTVATRAAGGSTGRAGGVCTAPRGVPAARGPGGRRPGIRLRVHDTGEYVEVPPENTERLSSMAAARLDSMGFVGWCAKDEARAGSCQHRPDDCSFAHVRAGVWPRHPGRSPRRRSRTPPRIPFPFPPPPGGMPGGMPGFPPFGFPPYMPGMPFPPPPRRRSRSRDRGRRRSRSGGSRRRRRSSSSDSRSRGRR